jgi:hypothetical protein
MLTPSITSSILPADLRDGEFIAGGAVSMTSEANGASLIAGAGTASCPEPSFRHQS